MCANVSEGCRHGRTRIGRIEGYPLACRSRAAFAFSVCWAAAALDGRPVFFHIDSSGWQDTEITAPQKGQLFANIAGLVVLVALLVAASLVTWRNVRLARGDTKAAWWSGAERRSGGAPCSISGFKMVWTSCLPSLSSRLRKSMNIEWTLNPH
jgi:hypothetical protein